MQGRTLGSNHSAADLPYVQTLQRDATVEQVNLFNNVRNIVVTNEQNDADLWESIQRVNLPAHNPSPGAPEHLTMVNNLLNDHGNNRQMRQETNLSKLTEAQWKKLAEHVDSHQPRISQKIELTAGLSVRERAQARSLSAQKLEVRRLGGASASCSRRDR